MPKALGYEVVRQATYYGQRKEEMSPQSITVIQRENNHEVVSLISYRDDNAPNRYDYGTPINVAWGLVGIRVEHFQGYVHHTEPVVVVEGERAHRNMVKVVCIGATARMKEKHQRFWKGRTIPSVLAEIFNDYKLSASIGRHDRVWESLVQAGESDWEFVCSLAKRIGWTVCAHNTEVRVLPRQVNTRHLRGAIALFQANTPMEPTGGLHQILSFQAIDGETTPDGGQKAARVAHGLDPWQGTPFVVEQDIVDPKLGWTSPAPVLTEYSTDTVRSYGEAADRLTGDAENARFYLQAKLEALGDAIVRPGGLVCLLGVGTKNSGLWYVEAVEHEAKGGNYYAYITLGRDARWDTGYRPSRQHRRVIQPRVGPYGDPVASIPPTVLIAGTWRAAYDVPVKS